VTNAKKIRRRSLDWTSTAATAANEIHFSVLLVKQQSDQNYQKTIFV
jgi:hypothetical protein